MPTKKVVFYSDEPITPERLPLPVQQKILKYFGAEEPILCTALPVPGFKSGVDWKKIEEEGVIAVVLVEVSEACAVGIYWEVDNETSSLNVYDTWDDILRKISPSFVTFGDRNTEELDLA